MTNEELLTRARSAIGKGCRYKLGCGGYHPKDDLPARPTWRIPKGGLVPRKLLFLDCSGFISWVLGRPRAVTVVPGMWGCSTDSIYRDATKHNFHFAQIDKPIPGCIAVYGDWKDAKGKTHQGHVAIVVDPDKHTVVDCSSSMDGVAEHVQEVFWDNKNHTTVWCIYKG